MIGSVIVAERCRATYGTLYRLDFLLEAEGDMPNRYKMSKQVDVLMLFDLFSADELRELFARLGYPFESAAIPRTIDYYLRRTSEGSTLSRVAHAWVLARSDRPASWDVFRRALRSDISDVQDGRALRDPLDEDRRARRGPRTRPGRAPVIRAGAGTRASVRARPDAERT